MRDGRVSTSRDVIVDERGSSVVVELAPTQRRRRGVLATLVVRALQLRWVQNGSEA